MTSLVRPSLEYAESWTAAVLEYAEDGTRMHGSGLWDHADPVAVGLETIVPELVEQATHAHGGRVPCSYFWIEDDGEFVGYLALRHTLNDWLLNEGGHIGYSVRPSRRRQGHASRALALGLAEAARLGLDRVLLTCDEDNDASRLTIEHGGGVYEDTRNGKRRYWIETQTVGAGTNPAGP